MPFNADSEMAEPNLDDEQYDSAEDEDFTLDPAAQDDDEARMDSSSDGSDDEGQPAAKKRKMGKKSEKSAEGPAELDSGDEAMIQKAKDRKKKQKERKKKGGAATDEDEDEDEDEDVDFDDEDEGTGEGAGFVRTRAMKIRVQEERKPLAKIDGATIDVDAIWARMNAMESEQGTATPQLDVKKQDENAEMKDTETRDQVTPTIQSQNDKQDKPPAQYTNQMIKIKRTYKFAGEMTTEEKLVARDSAEAKLYLANTGEKDGEIEIVAATDADETGNGDAKAALKFRRPLRRASRFDPNPSGSIKRSWEKQAIIVELAGQQDENARGPKINTVEKSRLDWAAYVDQAGIKDELRVHSKAKEGFLGRMDFLDRVDAKREEERRNARLKGR